MAEKSFSPAMTSEVLVERLEVGRLDVEQNVRESSSGGAMHFSPARSLRDSARCTAHMQLPQASATSAGVRALASQRFRVSATRTQTRYSSRIDKTNPYSRGFLTSALTSQM